MNMPVKGSKKKSVSVSGATKYNAVAHKPKVEVKDNTSLTPNKDKFPNGVPGEEFNGRGLTTRVVRQYLSGGRTLKVTAYGDIFEVKSHREAERERQEEEDYDRYDEDSFDPMDSVPPKISVEGDRHRHYNRTEKFTCDGTMYRHSAVSWKDAPIEFKLPHEVQASKENPVKCYSYEHKIEDLTPFYCDTIGRLFGKSVQLVKRLMMTL